MNGQTVPRLRQQSLHRVRLSQSLATAGLGELAQEEARRATEIEPDSSISAGVCSRTKIGTMKCIPPAMVFVDWSSRTAMLCAAYCPRESVPASVDLAAESVIAQAV